MNKYAAAYMKERVIVEAPDSNEARRLVAINLGIDRMRQSRIQLQVLEKDGEPVPVTNPYQMQSHRVKRRQRVARVVVS